MKYSLFLFVAFCFGSVLNAESEGILNKLLAPGPLIEGHKDLEGKDCLKCHDAGKGISDVKCLDCHKDIKVFLDSKKGFHGINNQACIKCHIDHKGRDFDSMKFNEKEFNHLKMTGYSLEGKHADIKCIECHTEKRSKKVIRKNEIRFMGNSSSCLSCHKKDDVHFFKNEFAKKDCNSCHSNVSWKKDIKFSHNLDTKFKLEGHHTELKCNDCHQPDKKQKKLLKYAWPNLQPMQCLACHQDYHKKNLSGKFANGKCTTCHTQQTWKVEKFNHEVTGFKLNGKHFELKCFDCHKKVEIVKQVGKPAIKKTNFTGLKTQCLACHKDFHQFGPFRSAKLKDLNNCSKCHDEKDWKQIHSFDHNKDTRFAISGQHTDLKCALCHLPNPQGLKTEPKNIFSAKVPTYHWQQLDLKTCETCHKSPHVGAATSKLFQQKCSTCHNSESWIVLKNGSKFDHSKTRFQIDGAHAQTRCSDCHGTGKTQVFKFKNNNEQFCIDCHNNIHTNQFSKKFISNNCLNCHTTEKFTTNIKFDHNKTEYPLVGSHAKLNCNECHTKGTENLQLKWPNFKSKDHLQIQTVKKAKYLFPNVKQLKCLACHTDYHKGQLSSTCTECHTESNWKPANFNHNTQSRFKLKEKHEKLECIKCHLPTKDIINYKNQNRFIVKYKPLPTKCIDCHTDIHKGQLSTNCNECHSESNWKPANFNHNTQSRFKLKDKHEKLECIKCHLPTKDIISYKNQNRFVTKYKPVGVNCVDCHKDPHKGGFGQTCQECHSEKSWKQTKDFHKNFTLTGVHYTLDCAECHRDGKKLAGLSQQCIACHQKDDVHNGMLPNCKSCHTQHFWEASQFRHSLTQFPLRGAHRTIDCAECHTNGIYKGLSTSCYSCHKSDFTANPTPHASGNTNCIECHKNTFRF